MNKASKLEAEPELYSSPLYVLMFCYGKITLLQ